MMVYLKLAIQNHPSLISREQIKFELPKWGNGYTHEIEEVHKCLKAGKLESELWSLNDSKNLISFSTNKKFKKKSFSGKFGKLNPEIPFGILVS